MENKYPIGIDPQEIWDEFSEYVDDDSDSFSRYAGRSVMLFDSFVRALAKIQQPPTGAIWVKASSGLPDDNIQRIWKWNKSGNPEWKRIELDTTDGIKRWVKLDKVDFDDIDLQYLDESSSPSKESDTIDLKAKSDKLALALRRLSNSMSVHPLFFTESEWGDYIAFAEEALSEWEQKELKP